MPGTPPEEGVQGASEPPQLAPLDVVEQQLYSELLLGDRAFHPIFPIGILLIVTNENVWLTSLCFVETGKI